jgi:LysM repeat protein
LKDDPTTALNYPSQGNFCQKARPVASVKGDYQRQYCLSAEHTACPVFQAMNPQPLPAVMTAQSPVALASRRTVAMIGIPLLLAGAAALAFAWNVTGGRVDSNKSIPITSMGMPGAWALLTTGTKVTPTITATQESSPTDQPTACPLPSGWVSYKVTPTDSLYRLSVIYGVSVERLQEVNCLGNETILSSGQVLYVPIIPTDTPLPTRIPFIPSSTPKPPERDAAPVPPANTPVPPQPTDKPAVNDNSGKNNQDNSNKDKGKGGKDKGDNGKKGKGKNK